MAYYRKSDNAKAQIVEHSPVTDSVYVQFYSLRSMQTKRMSKAEFDLIYRVEDCK